MAFMNFAESGARADGPLGEAHTALGDLRAAPGDLRTLGTLIEATAQIQRTMVLGLGGTGGEVIKRLKRRLSRQGQTSTYIRFLSLDTDVRTWLATLQFPALEPRERVPLYWASPGNVLEAPHLYPTIRHMFHQGRKVDISLLADQSGAGLMPVVGRIAFHLNAAQVYTQLQRALRDLQAMPSQPGGQPLTEEFRIYIVGSAAGGTGAGCFLETAVLTRHVFAPFKHQLIGVLALPEAFAPTLRGQQLDSQSRGNAYAILKELQYLMDGPVHWEEPEAHTFHYNLGGDVRTIVLNEKPFDIFYVIDNQNQEGGGLRNLTDIYEMAAQQLFVEIGSPLGAKFASAQANDRAIKGLAPCPETGRPANISSLATAALVVPEEKLLRYCSRRYLAEVLRERLLGSAPPAGTAEAEAARWLAGAELEERRGHRMISRALLTDARENRELTASEYAFDPDAAVIRSVADFLGMLDLSLDQFTGQGLPAVRTLIDKNLERLKSQAFDQVARLLEENLTARGLRATQAIQSALDGELQAMAFELARLQSDGEAVRAEAVSRLQVQRAELQNRAGLLGALFGKRRELMRLLTALATDLLQVELDIQARAGALRLLDGLRGLLAEHRRRLEGLESSLTRLEQTLTAEMTQEQWAAGEGSAYALETEVIRPEQFPLYYDRFRPASAGPFLEGLAGGSAPEGGSTGAGPAGPGPAGPGLLATLSGLAYGDLATRLARTARRLFAPQAERLNVVEVLQERYNRTEAFHLLDDLARRCQPFWTATPRGAGAFSDVFLIGSPGVRPGGPEAPVQAEPLLQEWVDQHAGGASSGLQSRPTYVALGSPGAIIFSRQTHGARLHYMRQILDYQEHYRMLLQQRGYPLHFKPAHEALPELRPDDDRATEAWALAVAYGMVAARTFGWVWAFDIEQRKDPDLPGGFKNVEVLRAGSLWDMAAEIVPVEAREIAPHSSRFLHTTRSGACAQFSARREWHPLVERQVALRLDVLGKQAFAAELSRYVDEVLRPRVSRAEEMEGATLAKEQAAIRRFLDRLNL